jgi:hypothetical protein
MNMFEQTGGPAFPSDPDTTYGGMTLRDYFAVHASKEDVKAQAEVIRVQVTKDSGIGILPDYWHIKARYMHADAMLKARSMK